VRTIAVLIASALAAVLLASAGVPASAASKRLPDLAMARLKNLNVQTFSDGRRLLRFDSTIVNVGRSRFELYGERDSAEQTTMDTVTQRLYDGGGHYRDRPTGASMYYGGDGHNHWHVRDLERFSLTRSGSDAPVRLGAKHGFCFWDTLRFGSKKDPFYTPPRGACGQASDLRVQEGLSVGWADVYPAHLPDQYVDVTGLPDGRYTFRGVADAGGWFREADESNNFTWTQIRLKGSKVEVLKHGPSARKP
jgi:hypothetical protein